MAFGSKVGSVDKLKRKLEGNKTSSGAAWMKYVPKNSALTVRFLTEPDEMVAYNESWDESARMSYPVPEGERVPDDQRVSTRYLCNALWISEDGERVVPLQLAKTVMTDLIFMYEKFGTLCDRDYEVSRSGAGTSTKYHVIAEAPLDRPVDAYKGEMHDLETVLAAAYEQYAEATGATVPEPKPEIPVVADVPADEDDEDEVYTGDEDDEGEVVWTKDDLKGKPIGELRSIARDLRINPKGLSMKQLVDAITGDDAF